MENVLGLLKVHVVRGVNLAVRDSNSSDPYVVVKMGDQKLKTHEKKHDVNPEWNEQLTLAVSEPILPIKIEVYDKDKFSGDDKMGDAEIDVSPLMEAVKMHNSSSHANNTVYNMILPGPENCLISLSSIKNVSGKIIQELHLRLRNVECGEVELFLEWVPVGSSKAS